MVLLVRPTFSPSSCCESWARMRAERMRVPTSVMATGTGLWGEKERRTTTRVAGRRNEPRRRDRPARREERNHGVAGDPEWHGCRLLPEPTGLTPDGPPAKPRWGGGDRGAGFGGPGLRLEELDVGGSDGERVDEGGRCGNASAAGVHRTCARKPASTSPGSSPGLSFASAVRGEGLRNRRTGMRHLQAHGTSKRTSACKHAREPPSTAPRTAAPR